MGILSLGRFLFRCAIWMLVITLIGQINYKGVSLENRYHDFVNSESVQARLEQIQEPIVWTYERAVSLVKKDNPLQAR
jgi:hypothetical protein